MKKKSSLFIFLFAIILAAILLYIIYAHLFNTKGKVNQGNYRVSDLVIKSIADVQDTGLPENQETSDVKDLSNITINVSQDNNILLQLANNGKVDVDSIYLDNISYTAPIKLGSIICYQQDQDQKYDLSKNVDKIPIKLVTTSDGQYLINLNINNQDMIKNQKVPKETTLLTYDGTILKTFQIPYQSIIFSIKFDLNIKEKSGKIEKCTFNFELPNQNLIDKGISITREKIDSYNFVIQNESNILKIYQN